MLGSRSVTLNTRRMKLQREEKSDCMHKGGFLLRITLHTYTHTYIHKYACVHAYMYARTPARTHSCTHTHTHTHTHTRTRTHTHTHTHSHSHSHTHTHTRARAHTHNLEEFVLGQAFPPRKKSPPLSFICLLHWLNRLVRTYSYHALQYFLLKYPSTLVAQLAEGLSH